jgi:hypothetical protein
MKPVAKRQGPGTDLTSSIYGRKDAQNAQKFFIFFALLLCPRLRTLRRVQGMRLFAAIFL